MADAPPGAHTGPRPQDPSGEPYLFWVVDPKTYGVLGGQRWVICSVDAHRIQIETDPIWEVGLHRITGLELRTVAQTTRVDLAFLGESALRPVVPINPIWPSMLHAIGDYHESQALIAVIRGFKAGRPSALARNPYQRRLRRMRWPIVDHRLTWEARVPPEVYARERNRLTAGQVYRVLAVGVALLLALAALFGGRLITFG